MLAWSSPDGDEPMSLRVSLALFLAGCGGASREHPSATTTVVAIEATDSVTPVPAEEVCVAAEPSGASPSILATVGPPPVSEAGRRAARRRGVILLDEIDGYGPLTVVRIDADGARTEIGPGESPRTDGADVVYLELAEDGSSTLVRLHPDGTVERRPGGTGLLGGLGGLAPFSSSPYTRDGAWMAAVTNGCTEAESSPCELVVYDALPRTVDDAVERYPLAGPSWLRPRVFSSADASVVAVCMPVEDHAFVLAVERATRAMHRAPLSGACHALTPDGSRLAVVRPETSTGFDLVTLATGAIQHVETAEHVDAAAFDACGTSLVVVGHDDATGVQHVDRVLFDGRPWLRLLEAPGTPVLDTLEVDPRGWILAATDTSGTDATGWLVALGGGVPATEHHVEGRVYGVTLGP